MRLHFKKNKNTNRSVRFIVKSANKRREMAYLAVNMINKELDEQIDIKNIK